MNSSCAELKESGSTHQQVDLGNQNKISKRSKGKDKKVTKTGSLESTKFGPKRSSIESNLIESKGNVRGANTVTKNIDTSVEKVEGKQSVDVKNSTTTSAFQRLVMASKRMMKKSSEKKSVIKPK